MIKTVKWQNDPVLGDLELDFSKPDGSVYNTIVIAGENGAGKTRILKTLATFLNLGSFAPFDYISYVIDGNEYTITPYGSDAIHGFHHRKKSGENDTLPVRTNRNNNSQKIKEDLADIRHYGCAYSKARSGFNTKPVKTSTTQQLGADSYDNDDQEDFTGIKQLLVDVKSQDNSAWDKLSASGSPITYAQFHETSKIYRFERAFNNFFQAIKFDGINEDTPSEKTVQFSKNVQPIAVDALSTGEKQIVFRGAQLLRNSGNLTGGTVLIDEPELSMHPKWQEKILQFYRGLFLQNGTQTAQMFFATRSENVIRAAVNDLSNVLIIILSEVGGTVRADKMKEIVLPSITAAEVNFLAFDLKSIDYHIALYGDFQTLTGKTRIADADAHIKIQREYDSTQHEKNDTYGGCTYHTLPTYIRNAIDHPDSGRTYTDTELEKSLTWLSL